MHGLGRADANQDTYHFLIRRPLRQRGIEAVAALFDRRKMESCRIGDRLKKVGIGRVGIGSGNRRMPPDI